MPNFVVNTLTYAGESVIAAAMAGTQMVITRVQVGSGTAGTGTSLPTLTALIAPVMNLTPVPPLVSANNLEQGEVIVMATLDTANVVSTFSLAELGVWATSGGGAEQLIAYCQALSPYDSIAPGSGISRLQLQLQVPIVVGVGASVSITLQPGNPVFVPPVVAGPGIVVQAPTDASGHVTEWIVSTPQITQNTTLYVANENNDVAPNFTTLNKAMAYLGGFAIAAGIQVTINMAAETFNQTVPQVINHPNGQQITIQGAIYPATSFTNIGTITGSAGNWSVKLLGVTDTSHIAVNTWLILTYLNPNAQAGLVGGMWKVTAVSGSTVTVQNWYWAASWPSMTGVSGNIQPLGTIIDVTLKGVDGIDIDGAGVGLMQNIGIIYTAGASTNFPATGLSLGNGAAYFLNIGVNGFTSNVANSSGFGMESTEGATLDTCAASNCDNGLTGVGFMAVYNCCFNSNTQFGIWIFTGATCRVTSYGGGPTGTGTNPDGSSFVCGNIGDGVHVGDKSYFVCSTLWGSGRQGGGFLTVAYNEKNGISIYNMATAACQSGTAAFGFAGNAGSYDVSISLLSSFSGHTFITGGARYNVTPGTLSADGCYVN